MLLETKKKNSKWGLLNRSVIYFGRNKQPINRRLAREVKRVRIAIRGRSEFTGIVCLEPLFRPTTIIANRYNLAAGLVGDGT